MRSLCSRSCGLVGGAAVMAAMLVMVVLAGVAPQSAAAASSGVGHGSIEAVAGLQVTPMAVTSSSTVLRRGMSGPAVRRLQQQLVDLGYWLGSVDGVYGYQTAQAVMAFQKVNRLERDGIAGPQTMRALANPRRPQPQSRRGLVIEVPKSTQVVLMVRDGRVRRIFNASTGTARTPTPNGRYSVIRQINGWRESSLGLLYRPKYFHRGYALHGSTSVPAYPASHGCVRVSLRAMDHLWSRVPVGTSVWVY